MTAKTGQSARRKSARKPAKAKTKRAANRGEARSKPTSTSKPKKVGRPSKYTPALGEKVCDLLVQDYTLRQIELMAGMPNKVTIIRWLQRFPEFHQQYIRAREVQALVTEDTIQEIADDSTNDWIERENAAGEMVRELNKDAIARAKLRIESRKWLNITRNRRYARQTVEVTGKDGGPIQTTVGAILDEIDGAGTGLEDDGGNA